MKICPSVLSDIDAIMAIYDHARQLMRESGNSVQWVNGYPQRSLIEEDIRKGVHYSVFDDNGLVAVFTLIVGDDPTYGVIEGEWLNSRPYGTIHRIGSASRRGGVLHEVLAWSSANVISNIRIDTHADNAPMLHLLQKEGFSYCGIIYVADGTPRKAFQRQYETGC